MDSRYEVNVCTAIAPGMDYIWRHGVADIQMPAPVGSKRKMENWRENSGDTKRRYEEAGHKVGASQGGVTEIWNSYSVKEVVWEKQGSE